MTGESTTRGTRLIAVLAFVTGCGGTEFRAAPATADAAPDPATDAPGEERSDASLLVDAPADSTGRTDSASEEASTADAGSGASDAATESSPSGSDAMADSPSAGDSGADSMDQDAPGADAAGHDAGPEDASADAMEAGEPETGIDAGIGDGSSDATDGGVEAEAEACTPVTFFLDGDGDGYGGTTTSHGCAPPASGTWVTTGGDCDDSNATVNPGQSAYFASGYTPTGKSTVSFDYDCDGQERESGDPAKASCKIVNLACGGSGYIEATPVRSGGGVDPFCGSVEAVGCALTNLVCQAGSPYTVSPIACH